MKTVTTTAHETGSTTMTGKTVKGTYPGFISTPVTCKTCGTGTEATTGSTSGTICVPRSYIVGTLCRNTSAISALGGSIFGSDGDPAVSVSTGIFLYSLYNAGSYELSTYFTPCAKVNRSEISNVPMEFLPPTVRKSWTSYVTRTLPTSGPITSNDVFGCWKSFIMTSVNTGTTSFGTVPATTNPGTCYNISKGLLMYTLYLEGATYISYASTSTGSPSKANPAAYIMNFLPTELSSSWKTTVTTLFSGNPHMSTNEIIESWKNFIVTTVGGNSDKYIRQFSMLCSSTPAHSNTGHNC